ncbi:hypothetical protein [Paenibacillus odorifer]|uniref:hypothetical protein n=1 Tax=Paenibacillus odorifer TaxID=189426 RepID=UPI001C4BDDFC|nr:hypothetical protein [Paenibacillus odorifer]
MENGWNELTISHKYDTIFKYVFDVVDPAHAVTAPIGYISAVPTGILPPRLGESET